MKVLIITQAVDKTDQNQGAFYAWWHELARQVEQLYIIGLRVGQFDLPKNTKVFSLKKDAGLSKPDQVRRFLKITRSIRHDVDIVLAHQCPIYVLASSISLPKVPKTMWFALGGQHWQTKLAEKLVVRIFTSTKEGFEVPSSKVAVIGQGIDFSNFKLSLSPIDQKIRLLYLGRISPQKNLETLIAMAGTLEKRNVPYSLTIAGGALTQEAQKYERRIKNLSQNRLETQVKFLGSVPHQKVANLISRHDVLVNPSLTGSLDKTMLEGIASGVLPINSNPSLAGLLEPKLRKLLITEERNAISFADKVENLRELSSSELNRIRQKLRSEMENQHSVNKLVSRMVKEFDNLTPKKD